MPQPQSDYAPGVDLHREMTGMIFAFCVSQIIRTAAELSLADHLAAGPLSANEIADLGFKIIRAGDLDVIGIEAAVDVVRRRVDDTPVYLSTDIDVLDPAFAPGTGTPESVGSPPGNCCACFVS
jgi:arginase family enzyme